MAIFDRFNIKAIAVGAGLCGAAISLGPTAAAVPLITGGGHACVHPQAGEVAGAPALADGIPAAGGAGAGGPVCAPIADMAGAVPAVVPGAPVPLGGAPLPFGAPVPLGGAPVPMGAPLPIGAPLIALGAPLPVGAPIIDMAGTGKERPTDPAPTGGPAPAQGIKPGPAGPS